MSRISLFPRQSRLSRAVRGALAILALGAAASAWAVGTGELPASAAGAAAPLTVTVQPGQSLNDIAKAATQSHDPAVLARAGRALFDANPQAFMKRDASRLKVGATLTVPALDATGAALAPAGASAASSAAAASAPAAASGGAAIAQHGASAPHPGSAVQPAPVAPAVHAAPVSGASVATATAAGALASSGASASIGASAAYGASAVESTQPAASTAGASGPHVWSGAIQSAPSSASDAAGQAVPGSPVSGVHEPAGAAPAVSASQPRPSSLQQLLALKNRVLMELQKHGIGKPAATTGVAPAPAPAAPRPATNDAGASAAASTADEAASGAAASAPQPASASVQPVAPVATPARRTEQMDWRPVAVAGAAVIVLAAGFAWRNRRKGRRADDASTVAAAAAAGAAAATETEAEATPSVERELPITPEMPVARDAASDMNLAAATAAAAETIEPPAADTSPAPEVTAPRDESPESPPAHAAEPVANEATPAPVEAPHDAEPAGKTTAADQPADPTAASAALATTEAQHASLMQNAISALNSLDMPLPPRTADEPSSTAEEPSARAVQSDVDKIATNGQSAHHPPMGAGEPAPEHPADQDDEFDWDPDAATPASQAGSPPVTTSLPPLGGAQFGALKLDFDLDLPSTPGAALPALTPNELARIARNKLDLAAEYVELGDLSGARTLLQEVVDANDAATRDDARALLAKLADEA
ncbi:pilus assembly protein FimV [Burkholderia cenocepacia]|uniref:FimV/HubP family polar landmark protein n=1 Tax=Burkholderia cepacia complex TaxID=87882 RepID=UPI000F5B4F0F|nr:MULTISPECIES: FimV/HubP family polar landmark protein [Burkholderia cepacia complex]ELW9447159.1 pilus assembly protein FimV [Burkholderia cenocepacia]MBR8481531.1 pilus assembly protein FimV [Burkholderia cenocepacia]MDN7466534.1 FimV/HubP family polar landmark protein [Burkholderia orbicola]MDN7501999.1 FimV/HubP family polar landmark protein [Burkholderia orbicola]RQU12688.1 pilus assembly protein FimV [Burkholderia cenocepacia]